MRLNDPILAEIVKNGTPIRISGMWFKVEPSPQGFCDGCYFLDKERCPQLAVSMCCSNGGNIFKLVKDKD